MKAQFVNENVRFERSGNPNKSMGIGKYRPAEVKFKNSDGEIETIEVKDDEFKLRYMNVRLEFGEADGHEIAKVYVDDQESDMNVFLMTPAEYEFFVPNKPTVEIDGKYEFDPNPENWSKTESAYGFPLVDKNDREKMKKMQEEHGYWHVSSMDYTKTDKNPFAAVAKMILYTY